MKFLKVTVLAVVAMLSSVSALTAQNNIQKVLFVVTSHEDLGDTGKKTGYYLSEVAHPWHVLTEAGYEIEFVSPKGGEVPVDGFDLKDAINKQVWEDATYQQKIKNTMKPSEVNPTDYVAIHYAGGHGTMWDFPDNKGIADIARQIYENEGVVSAVCHGPAGLVNIKLSDDSYLIDGKKVNTFTNQEERAMELEEVVPFMLEDKLLERGAIIEKSSAWSEHVTVDGRLVTGQNPNSATAVGKEVRKLLENKVTAN